MKKRILLFITILFFALATLIGCSSNSDNSTNNNSFKYHKENIAVLSTVANSIVAEKMLSGLENSCAIVNNTKLVAEDIIEYNDNWIELYAGLMVRFYIQDGEILLYTFETVYSDDTAILLYDSAQGNSVKILTERERNSLIYTQRRAVVHSTLEITPREGALLHNALGSTKIDLTFRNRSYPAISYLNIVITPYMSGVDFSSKNKGYTLDVELSVGGTINKSITTTGWSNYDSYKITKATIMFTDGTTIGFDSFDCQFLDGNGDSSDTILKDSQITYHLYDEQTEVQNFYSGFGNGLNTPYRYGYNFLGWYDNAECVGDSIEKIAIGKQVNIDLYAKWEEKNYINYHYQYEDKEEKVYVEDGEKPTITVPTRLGYTFDGWYNNTSFVGNAIMEISPLLENVELYAKWTGNPVYLIYDGNGSTSGQMSNQLFRVGDTLVLNENSFLRDGYTFIGWSIEKTSNDIIQDKGEYTMQPTTYEAVKIYARWSKEIRTIEDFNTIDENNSEYYVLLNDIDFENERVNRIDNFCGVFDGKGHTLKNSDIGLFLSNEGIIKNLIIENCAYAEKYISGEYYIGGFLVSNSGTILNCGVKSNLNPNERGEFGGFCATNLGRIVNSYAKINTTVSIWSGYVGGFVGSTGNYSSILNCYSEGTLTVKNDYNGYTGGFVGAVSHGEISSCYSNIHIYSNAVSTGGFLGVDITSNTIKNCFALGIMEIETGSRGGFCGDYSLMTIFENVFRSDINLFETIRTEGTLTPHQKFYTKDFYDENNLLEWYINETTLQENENAVWILTDGELPKLYWESSNE